MTATSKKIRSASLKLVGAKTIDSTLKRWPPNAEWEDRYVEAYKGFIAEFQVLIGAPTLADIQLFRAIVDTMVMRDDYKELAAMARAVPDLKEYHKATSGQRNATAQLRSLLSASNLRGSYRSAKDAEATDFGAAPRRQVGRALSGPTDAGSKPYGLF